MKTIPPERLSYLKFLFLLIAGVGSTASAYDLNWSLTLLNNHKLSTGQPIPQGTRFQLGLFTGGFVPTAANQLQWLANWRSRAETIYEESLSGFGGTMHVEENPAPFLEGVQLFVWGFRQTSASTSEWILLTDPTWKMPSSDPLTFPKFIDMPDASQVILGSTDKPGKTITMAAVTIGVAPMLTYADWLTQEFYLVERNNPAIVGRQADQDGDGIPNIVEYMQGTLARYVTTQPVGVLEIQPVSPSTATLSFPANPSAAKVWNLQTSIMTSGWEPTSPGEVYNGVSQRWSFTVPLSGGRRFWRLEMP